MEENSASGSGTGFIKAFDSFYTTNRIQMLKILLSRLSSPGQGYFAVYIKFLELQYAMQLSRSKIAIKTPGQGKGLSLNLLEQDNTETIELLDELLPFSSPEEQKKIENIKSMLNNLVHMKEMMEMIQTMQELFPEGFGNSGQNPADILSGMSGMGGMDMSPLFQMFSGET